MKCGNLTTKLFVVASVITINFSSVFGLASSSKGGNRHFVGFDLGTSGVRISIIQENKEEVFTDAIPWDDKDIGSYDDPDAWMKGIGILFQSALDSGVPLKDVVSICVSGTSSSCLLVDTGLPTVGKVTRSPRMYNYDVTAADDGHYGTLALEQLDKYAPPKHTTRSPTSSFAKLLAWNNQSPLKPTETLCHQSDYCSMKLMLNDKACGSMGQKELDSIRKTVFGISDWQNCLKLGFDVQELHWPDWLLRACYDVGIDPVRVLPQKVVSPGERIGTISKDVAKRYGLSESTVLVGGTTDSNAAFFAALGSSPSSPGVGTAVTSLGSTLAIKQWSQNYVEDSSRGVYSHRFPSVLMTNTHDEDDHKKEKATWLVGGASNVGCAVLRQEDFSSEELQQLSSDIDPMKDSPLSYYPLAVKKGERFPTADSNKEPILTPKPDERSEYLHGILQGIARVERDGFQILGELGSLPKQPTIVLTCGGGSKNPMWSQMRERILNEAFAGEEEEDATIKVEKAINTEASFGAAVLAAATFVSSDQ